MIPGKQQFVNIHAHRYSTGEHEWVLTSVFAGDYPPSDPGEGALSVGLHPWHLATRDLEQDLNKIRLACEAFNVLAVGEAGLDKLIDFPLDKQIEVFAKQVDIAEFADLPLIIHNVKASAELIAFMKSHRPVIPMIIHGFRGSMQLADDLLNAGFFLSFGKHFLKEEKVRMALQAAPVEKIFLETDDADTDIRDLYREAAALKTLSMDFLRIQVLENTRVVLGNPE